MEECLQFGGDENRDSIVEELIQTKTATSIPITYISASTHQQNHYQTSRDQHNLATPNIFVKIPSTINQQFQQNTKNPIKDEPIKFETAETAGASQKLQPPDPTKNPQVISIFPSKSTINNRDLFQLLPSPGNLITAKPKETLKCFKCHLCPFLTVSETNYENHKTENHTSSTSNSDNLLQLQCLGCENKFTKEKVLRLHLLEEHGVAATEIDVILTLSKEPTRRSGHTSKETPSVVGKENSVDPTKRRIYLKNVQSLQNPGLSQTNEVSSAPKSGKIFIKNVQLLRKPNLEPPTSNIGNTSFDGQPSYGGEHESQFSFEVPYENNGNGSVVSNGQATNTSQLIVNNQQLFGDGGNILCQPNYVENSGYSLGNFNPDNQSIVFSNSMATTQTSQAYGSCYSIANITPPSTAVACDQFSVKQSSKIFIKDIKVLKNPHLMTPPLPTVQLQPFQIQHLPQSDQHSHLPQPAIHLKSVRELNLMTLDQVQVQNLLPLHHHHQYSSQESDNGASVVYESLPNYVGVENGSNTEPEDMELELDENIVVDDDPDHSTGQSQDRQQQQRNEEEAGNEQCYYESNPFGQEPSNENSESLVQNLIDDFDDHNLGDGHFSNDQATDEEVTTYAELSTISLNDDDQKKMSNNDQVGDNGLNFFNLEETDDDILYVCAEELINSNLQHDEQLRMAENKSESSVIFEEPAPVEAEREEEDVLGQHERKGRIYVATNLMEQTPELSVEPVRSSIPIGVKNISMTDRVTVKPSNRGRPKGAKCTGITKLKKTNRLFKSDDIGIKCSQPGCGIRFKTQALIVYHERCHGADQATVCPECGSQDFKSWNTLHTHLWRVHQLDMELYSCHMCTFKTPIFTRLTNIHMKIHSEQRDFVCQQCNKAFKNSKQLKNHRRNHRLTQAAESLLSCPTCSLKFVSPDALKAHVEKIHVAPPPKEWPCSTCGMKYGTQSAMRTHAKEHIEGKRYLCEDCEYSTKDHNALRRHKMTHSRTRQYKCPHCNYTCIQSTTYRIHLQKRHENEARDLIYKCNRCLFVTINKVKYERHMSKKHKITTIAEVQNVVKVMEPPGSTVHQLQAMYASDAGTTTIDEGAVAELRGPLDVVVLE